MKNKTHKSSLLALCTVVGLTAQSALAVVIYQTGFESPEYTGGTAYNSGNQLTSQGWTNALGSLPNFDVYTYAGAQVPYTPNGAVPVIGGIPQLVTPTQNVNGGLQFAANGNQSGDKRVFDFSPIPSGLVEMSIDYNPGLWFDNNGGNLNGGFTLRSTLAAGDNNHGGVYSGRATSQPSGDVNGNGKWSPLWMVFNSANVQQTTAGVQTGYRFGGVTGFDELDKEKWYRLGYVWDRVTGRVTQLKTQELSVGAPTYSMDNPQVAGQDLYVRGGATPVEIGGVRLYNVGNGTLSSYDNLYVGDPYTWAPVVPEPSTVGLLLAGLSGLGLVRRRKK